MFTVHPHACGDNVVTGTLADGTPGSPPRLWGQCLHDGRRDTRERFTPTPVGTIEALTITCMAVTVHPHACGEMPRTARRGGQSVHPHACGEIRMLTWPALPCSVHPHACGDNPLLSQPAVRACGSPPRLWGQCIGHVRQSLERRFTPTPVGTIAKEAPMQTELTVHPHACGDNAPIHCTTSPPFSVHPHACGEYAPVHHLLMSTVHPHACGECAVCCTWLCPSAVHPHACGDNARGSG